VDKYIRAELDKRFAEYKASGDSTKESDGVKSIASLALNSYMSEFKISDSPTMDPVFKKFAASQIRMFMLAGHDTSSTAIVYALHCLYTNTECLAKARAEHDAVFGTDPSKASSMIAKDPSLLNQLPYTLAAIKEALRLFPPGGSMRAGDEEIILTDEQGRQFPTANCAVWILHHGLHINPQVWPEPQKFIPERFLAHVGPEDPLHPVKGAWRGFEFGPRNCIGQTLALVEIKLVLVMVLREFDMSPAYDEWDEMHPTKGIKTVAGERAYMVQGGGGGAHPTDRYPCRVKIK